MPLPGALEPAVGVVAFSSPLEVGADQAPGAADALARWLVEQGCRVVAGGAVGTGVQAVAAGRAFCEAHVDAVAAVAVSWYEDYLAVDLLEECRVPLVAWSLPGMETGALCGTQQLTCQLKALGWPYSCTFGDLEARVNRDRALAGLRAAAVRSRLRRARIGLAGHRVAGMTHTSPNEFGLKKALGPRVVALDLPDLLGRAQLASPEESASLWADLKSRAGACTATDEAGLDSMAVFVAIRDLVAEQGLDALTIGCYPDLMGRVCLAASLLADQGMPLACEGDVNGAVAQLMLTLLTGQPTHNTDFLNPLPNGTIVFSHCGSGSLSLADHPTAVTLGPVRLMGKGACAMFTAKHGPVTLLSLTAHGDGYQCALLAGEALPTDMVFPGNPLRVRFPQPIAHILDWIHDEGIGHHWMAGYGDVATEIRDLARFIGPSLRLVEP